MNDKTLNQAINMGIDVLLVDVANNKTSKVTATPGTGGKWDLREVCTTDPESCDDHDHGICNRCGDYSQEIADPNKAVNCTGCGYVTPADNAPPVAVCDDCATVAYDHNVEASAMVEIGSDSEDHDCIYYLEPEDRALPSNRCACSCHPAIK